MSHPKKSRRSGNRKIRKSSFGVRSQNNMARTYYIGALLIGVILAVGGSVWATTVGDSISVTSGFSVNGNSTFGDASGDINVFTGTLQASTTALFTGASTFYDAVTIGDAYADALTINSAMTVNTASSTVTNLTMVNSTTTNATTTYLNIGTGGLLTSAPSSTINNLTMVNSTTTNATSTVAAFSSIASTSVLVVSNTLTINAASTTFVNAGTTTIPSANANSWTYATSSASIPFIKYDTSNTRVGISTTTPGATLAVGGDGTALIMGIATSTLSIQSTGPHSGASQRGGCIELQSSTGSVFNITATSAQVAMLVAGSCR